MQISFLIIATIVVIYSLILISGKRIMFKMNIFDLMFSLFILCNLITPSLRREFIRGGSNKAIVIITTILILAVIIGQFIRSIDIYSIHNVNIETLLDIIEKYLQRKDINYIRKEEEIKLTDLEKSIFAKGTIRTTLHCREVKDLDFYEELIDEIRKEIKNISKKQLPIEGIYYLSWTAFFCWFEFIFLK